MDQENKRSLAPSLKGYGDVYAALETLPYQLYDYVVRKIIDQPGSAIVPVPDLVMDTIRLANRMCRFVLDDAVKTHIGTGFLVGPNVVLTAAHLFFHDEGEIIESDRHKHVHVEFETLKTGPVIKSTGISTAALPDANWLVDPPCKNNNGKLQAQRDVRALDYAIIRLKPGWTDHLGVENRDWFQILSPEETPTVAVGSMIKILQYVDRGDLRQSLGYVTRISPDRTRLFYTASTLDAASGSAVLDDKSRLVAVHTGGAEEVGLSENRGMPIIRAAAMLGSNLATISPPLDSMRTEGRRPRSVDLYYQPRRSAQEAPDESSTNPLANSGPSSSETPQPKSSKAMTSSRASGPSERSSRGR